MQLAGKILQEMIHMQAVHVISTMSNILINIFFILEKIFYLFIILKASKIYKYYYFLTILLLITILF